MLLGLIRHRKNKSIGRQNMHDQGIDLILERLKLKIFDHTDDFAFFVIPFKSCVQGILQLKVSDSGFIDNKGLIGIGVIVLLKSLPSRISIPMVLI